ncbi:MAG: Hsp20/alpha crystallin family protein [Gammaproteobacteria bacterium]
MSYLLRWDPMRELQQVSERLNDLFGQTSPVRSSEKEQQALKLPEWTPSVDIIETDKEYEIKADLPAVKKEDVKVNIHDGVLCIEGERKLEKEEKNKKFHRIERSYGSFMRSFTLPDNADENNIHAEFKDGLLTVRLPKSDRAKPKSIEVKVS